MGLYDREYYREDYADRAFWQLGVVTIALVSITVAVFFLQLFSLKNEAPFREFGEFFVTDPILKWCGFSHEKILQGEAWRLITSLFVHPVHGSLWLFAASIAILVYCGRSVEGTYGAKEMFWYYLFAGLITQLAFLGASVVASYLELPTKFKPLPVVVGTCAGPVAAVMVLFALMSPNTNVPLVFYSVRASLLASIIVVGNLLLFLALGFRHYAAIPVLSGAAFAFAYYHYGWRVSNWVPDLPGLRGRAKGAPKKSKPLFQDAKPPDTPTYANRRPSQAVKSAEDSPITPIATGPVDEQLEAQVDRVLAKVSQFGKSSLTVEENAILQRASEVYKNRKK
jgi:membrane associated rhomboid family serine protease